MLQSLWKISRYRNSNDMPAARRIVHGLAVSVFHDAGGELDVAGRADQFEVIAGGEFVFHVDGQPLVVGVGDGADHLLGAKE